MATRRYFIGVGDIHDDVGNIERIPDLAGAAGVIVSGDLTIRGGEAAAKRVVEAIRRVNPVILAQIGNMDRPEADAYLTRDGINIHASGRIFPGGLGIFGVGWSTPTPFGTPSEADDARIAAWLEAALASVAGCDKRILVCHTPPAGTAADALGPGRHVGSLAVRAFIERVQPDLCLTGHIHEAVSVDAIGKTRIINPGMLASGGYAHIEVAEDGIKAALRRI